MVGGRPAGRVSNGDNPVRRHAKSISLAITLQPRASDTRLAGLERRADGTIRLKVRVTAPPSDGAANRALIKLLAQVLDVAPSRVTIEKGDTDRRKLVVIEGDPDMLELKLKPWLTGRP